MVQRISLAHGEGGELTHRLIRDVFIKAFGSNESKQLDAAFFNSPTKKMAVSTDSYVVKPIFFPGGNIGKLAISGTVNDLSVCGALPLIITVGFIIEEGFPLGDLKEVVQSMATEAETAGVKIIAGDTKVVEKGNADGLFINTTGIGLVRDEWRLNPDTVQEGDSVIVSGTIGDHGISILAARKELGLITEVASDCASLNRLIQELLHELDGIRLMRDPTRGGLATTLFELCEDFHFTVELEETSIPVRRDVHGACDILGFDPLYLANEGKVVMIVNAAQQQKALEILKRHPFGKDAEVIGSITSCKNPSGKLLLRTPIGTTRRLHRLSGLLLPRIC